MKNEIIGLKKSRSEKYLDFAGVIIVVIDPDQKVSYINKTGCEILGYNKKKIIGTNWFDNFIPARIKNEIKSIFDEIMAGKIEFVEYFENPILTKTGEERIIEWHNNFLQDDQRKIIGTLGSGIDITERKKAEHNLKESEEKYRTVFENTGTATAILEEDTTITLVNERFEELSGYSKEEIEGKKSWTEFVVKEDLERMKKYHYSRRKDPDIVPKSYEFRFINREGNIRNIYITIDIIPGTKKSVASLLDITERQKAEQNLKEYTRKMEVLNRIIIAGNKFKDLSLLLEYILNSTLELMNLEGGGIYLADHTTKTAELVCFNGLPPGFIKEVKCVKINEGSYNIVFNEGQSLITEDYSKLNFRRSKKWGILSLASIPFFVKNKVFGALNIASKKRHFFTNEEKNILQSILQETGAIIEKMQAEENLKESEEKYRHLFESSPYSIGLLDLKGNLIDCNTATNHFLSTHTKDDLIGKDFKEIFSFNKKNNPLIPIFEKHIKQALKGEPTESFEFPLSRTVGDIIWINLHGSLIEIEDKKLIQFIIRDITERRKAEQKLKESEEKYRGILENIKEGYYEVDLKGNLTFYNSRLAEFLGYTKNDIMGYNYSKFIDPEYKKEVSMRFNKAYENKLSRVLIEFKTIRKDGQQRFIESSVYVKRDSKGNRIGFYGLSRDITERKIWELKLKESEEKYREAYNRVDFYKDLFSHDMNNILQNILSSTEMSFLYLGEKNILPEVKDLFNTTKQQVRRGANLISNVQKLSELEEIEIITQPIEVFKVLKETIEVLKRNFQKRKINVEIETESKKLYVNANELLINAFENILTNAVKYNESPIVEILIKISKTKKEGNEFIKIEFIDNGFGISDDQKKIIFDRAFRADKSTSGMGLGLSLVKKIISLYDGDIWVEDKVQGDYLKGSSFIIIIPEV